MRLYRAFALIPVIALVGCRSAFVTATIQNRSSETIDLLEVDYPSASFGTQSLAAGADFHYRFKVLGDGKIKLVYTNAAHQEQKSEGPTLNEGDEGSLTITILPHEIQWQNHTRPK